MSVEHQITRIDIDPQIGVDGSGLDAEMQPGYVEPKIEDTLATDTEIQE